MAKQRQLYPAASPPKDESVAGQNAHIALRNLLVRSVPAKSLLHRAAQEWNASAKLRPGRRLIGPAEITALTDLDHASTVAEYKAISQRVNGKSNEIPLDPALTVK